MSGLKIRSRMHVVGTTCVIVGAGAIGGIEPAHSQEQPKSSTGVAAERAEAASEEAPPEVTITGSRITRRDFVANTPIVTVDASHLQNSSAVTVGDTLKRYPQFGGSGTGGETGTSGVGGGNLGTAQVNLRNLGSNRNLVLLDGRRMQPTALNFAVDVNTVPTALIDGVEVVTGGASAAYGSDAISGVVNFKLKNNFEGIELTTRLGASHRSDYQTRNVDLVLGTNFADNRGNMVLAAGFAKRGETLLRDIDFFRRGMQAGQGSQLFSFLGVGYYRPFGNNYSPVVAGQEVGAPGPLANGAGTIAFNSDNTSVFTANAPVYNYTGGVFPDNPKFAISPAGNVVYNGFYPQQATSPLERKTLFARTHFDITDDANFYTQAMYSRYTIDTVSFESLNDNFWGSTIPRDAAHPVSTSFGRILDSRTTPGADWYLGRTAAWAGPQQGEVNNELMQFVAGFTGSLPGNDWTWDVYGSYGETDVVQSGDHGVLSTTRINELLRSPQYGAGYTPFGRATPVCTSGISPFISNSAVTQDCIDYVEHHPVDVLHQQQTAAEATLQGKAFNLPAGEVRFAAGAGYRRNNFLSKVDDAYQVNAAFCPTCTDIGGIFARPTTSGGLDVWEGFGELLVPVLADLPLVKKLELDLGYRYSTYKRIGGANTYKIDANWQLVDSFSLRGGFQHAVRAPNPLELFSAPQVSNTNTSDPCAASGPSAGGPNGNVASNPNRAQVQALCAALTPGSTAALFQNPSFIGSGTPFMAASVQGNPNLSPETADTVTFGAVFQPKGELPLKSTLNITIDYYSIKLDEAIGSLNATEVYGLCFNYNGRSNPTYDPTNLYCQTILRTPSPTSIPVNATTTYLNQGGIKTDGIDLQSNWGLPIGPGQFNLGLQINRLLKFERARIAGDPFLDYAGFANTTEAYFKWRGLADAAYSIGKFNTGLRMTFLSSADDLGCVTAATCPRGSASYSLVDYVAGYRLTDNINLAAGVDNLLDRQPVIVGGILGTTNSSEYRVVGRSFWLSAQARF